MAGQGLGPLMNKKPDIMIAPPSRALARLPRRDSPTYDPYRCCTQQTLLAQKTLGSCLYKLPQEGAQSNRVRAMSLAHSCCG